MTQSLSFIVADRPPAMYRSETLAIVVSRTSMNVGTTTADGDEPGIDRRAADRGRGECHAAHDGLLRDDSTVKDESEITAV